MFKKSRRGERCRRITHNDIQGPVAEPGLVAYAIVIAVLYDTCHFFFGHHDLACFGWPTFLIIIQKSMTWETEGSPWMEDVLKQIPYYLRDGRDLAELLP